MRCHQHTQSQLSAKPFLLIGLFLSLIITISWLLSPLLFAQTTGNQPTVGLQGRLLKKTGTPVNDGYYNMQFRIYQGGSGQKAGNPGGNLIWQEDYLNQNSTKAVKVTNGRFAVNLGSQKAFSADIDWSKNNLWLSMNIAGSSSCSSFGSSSCPADGELLPMKHVSATPFAISAGKLGDKDADDFVQMGQGKQTDSSDGSSIHIDKTGQGDLIQLQQNGEDSFIVKNDGDIVLNGRSDRSITLTKSQTEGGDLALQAGQGETEGGDLILSGGDGQTGGDIILRGGTSQDGQTSGLVIIGTPTFSTTTSDPNCYPDGQLAKTSCQLSQKSIDSSAAIIVGFAQANQAVDLPGPTRQDPGQLRYIIGASDSEPFTINLPESEAIMVDPNTAAAVLWNGQAWISMSQQTPTSHDSDDSTNPKDTAPEHQTNETSETTDTEGETVSGSMYYNEKLGKIQCYQDESWGDCSSAPDVFVTISPEYANAVMNGSDIGTITSDFCSDQLGVNNGSDDQPEICDQKETHNFYQWSTDQAELQTRSIYISYKLPANFKEFVDDSASLTARTDSQKADVGYRFYRDNKTDGLTACGEATMLTSKDSKWHVLMADGQSDPANCDFSPGDSLLIRVDLEAENNSSAYVSDINFIYSSH